MSAAAPAPPLGKAARRWGTGPVLGIDLSARMLELARARCAAEGLNNVTYERGNAQVFPFEPAVFDVAMSSFGTHVLQRSGGGVHQHRPSRATGRPAGHGGVADAAGERWLMALRGALALGATPDAAAGGAHPFSLADPEHVRGLLGAAGFEAWTEPVDEPIELGADAADAHGVRVDDGDRRGSHPRPRPGSAGPRNGQVADLHGAHGEGRRRAPRFGGLDHHRPEP